MLNQHKITLLFTTFQLSIDFFFLLMIKWYTYEIIIYYFKIVLKNSKDPDSWVFWTRIRIEIFSWIQIRIRIQLNTDPKHCALLHWFLKTLTSAFSLFGQVTVQTFAISSGHIIIFTICASIDTVVVCQISVQ